MLTYNLADEKGKSLYEKLYTCLKRDISARTIAANTKLPSKREFALALGVSIITVEHAYQQLAAEGYIRTEQRRGYFVNDLGGSIRANALSKPKRKEQPEPAERKHAADMTGRSIAPCAFPFRAWQNAMKDILDRRDVADLEASSIKGSLALRKAIAEHVRGSRGISVHPGQIVIGAGAQFLYNMVVQIIGSGKKIALEDPGYPRLAKIYQASGTSTCYIGMDESGAGISDLEQSGADAVHIMPSHHFPTGTVMPVSRRYELLAWAAEKPGRYIVEDDYDCEFRYTGMPIPAMQGIDGSGCVIYINTFAKTLASGTRIGYMILPEELAERFDEEMDFYSCPVPALDQLTLASLMESGAFDKHVNRMRRRYRLACAAATKALKACREHVELSGTDAGLHFLMKLPQAPKGTAQRLAEALDEQGILIRPLSYYANASEVEEALVINYASLDEETAEKGAAAVAAAVNAILG